MDAIMQHGLSDLCTDAKSRSGNGLLAETLGLLHLERSSAARRRLRILMSGQRCIASLFRQVATTAAR
jgi:hypothetical protein